MSLKHKRIIKVVTGLLSALIAFTAYAASGLPTNVTGVKATLEDGKVTVNWNPATDAAGIAYYRVYFGRDSILRSSGDYDDFERTAGAETTYTFTNPPYHGKTAYFSVLAVNKGGAESDAFESEAQVEIPAAASSASAEAASGSIASPPSSQASSRTPIAPLTLQKVEAVSATGVLLTFSAKIQSNELRSEHFIVTDFSGVVLRIQSIAVSDATILLKTDPQMPKRPYIVAVLKQLSGQDGSQISGSPPQVAFAGYTGTVTQYGKNPVFSQPADTVPPEDATNLTLKPKLQKDGTYSVDAYFEGSINSAKDLASYSTYTTGDGENFLQTSTEGPETTRVRYQKVAPGTFGVKVTALDATGNESRGIAKVIHLPESGLGLLGIMAIAGAIAGRRMRRKKGVQE